MLAREVDRRLPPARPRGARPRPRAASTSPTPARSTTRSAASRRDAVINCAAWSDVDGAEDDERGAMRVNDEGAALLAAAAERVGASVLYPSSDYVFDGTKQTPYVESDIPNPISAYGRTQARRRDLGRGRQPTPLHRPRLVAVRARPARTSSRRCCRSAPTSDEVLVVNDQRGCPTSCADLAEAMAKLIETEELRDPPHRRQRQLHLVRLRVRRSSTRPNYETRVMSTTTEMMARKAPRPAYSVLVSERPSPSSCRTGRSRCAATWPTGNWR